MTKTMNEDDKIRKMFEDFRPELSSDMRFMSRLERNMKDIEMIRRKAVESRVRGRRAVAIAACAGFITGMLFSLLLPGLGSLLGTLLDSMSIPTDATAMFGENGIVLLWLLVAAVTVASALGAYDIALFLQNPKKEE